MKSLGEMDLDQWELLPDDGFLEIHDDGGKKIYSRNHATASNANTNTVFEMNYFICPTKPTQEFVENTEQPDQVQRVPFPVVVEQPKIPNQEVTGEEFDEIKSVETGDVSGDQDPISQVFFKKMKETEFVDMKVESPKSNSSSRGIVVQNDFQLETGKGGDSDSMDMEEENDDEGGSSSSSNIWKWSLNGIGAICSFGMAAATVCIIVLSSHRKSRNPLHNHKLQFQIYANDKRVKQAISAVRGVPNTISRAQITFGGYYDSAAV